LALESTATGAAVATGVSGVTMTAGRASPAGVLAVAAGRDWLAGACATGGTAGARRRSATRSHAAVAVSSPPKKATRMIRSVLTEIMVAPPSALL